jgi:hypothetical protein
VRRSINTIPGALAGLCLLAWGGVSHAAVPPDWWIVPAGKDKLALLQASGARILGYQPNAGYLVEMPAGLPATRQQLAQLGGRLQPVGDRIAPGLVSRLGKSGAQMQAIELVGPPGSNPEHLYQALRKQLDRLILLQPPQPGRLPVLRVEIDRNKVAAVIDTLAANGQILWADEFRPMRWLNRDSVEPVQGNTNSNNQLPANTPIWNRGIIGSGQVVAVADQGLDRNEQWFRQYDDGSQVNREITDAQFTAPPAIGSLFPERKVIAYWIMPGATAYDNGVLGAAFHGTHVTGTVAGDSGSVSSPLQANYDDGDGMAPNAQILFQDLGDDNSGMLAGQGGPAMWAQALAGGAYISSNSYGASGGAAYPASSALLDDFLWQNPDMLVVVAAGNDGSAGSMQINHPGSAKHALTVGATAHGADPSVAAFSSRGPAADGRIKPDLVAPGNAIRSAGGDTNNSSFDALAIRTISGTSMSTPVVAGAAALVRQYFADGFYPTGVASAVNGLRPSGALLKAVLLNGTRSYAQTPAPDSGWGRVWLDNNLFFPGDSRQLRLWDKVVAAGLANGEMDQYPLRVEAGQELRVTLVWYDPAALPSNGMALVNNLDLELVTPTETLLGNVLLDSQSTAGGSPDSLNPVEQVRLTAPTAGDYTVRVRASAVPGNGQPGSARQAYALVVSSAQCETAAGSAPAFSLASDINGVQLSLSAMSDYQVYRIAGNCAADPAGLRLLGNGSGVGFTDDASQGGFEYAYRLRSVDGCGEGPLGACQSIVSQAPCTNGPVFDSSSQQLLTLGDACGVSLSWSAVSPSCPAATISYSVYRSSDPFFVPGAGNLIASGLANPKLLDLGPTPGITHYYRVRAIDSQGNASADSSLLMYPAVGTGQRPGDFVDGAESLALARLDSPWQLTASQFASGARSYHNAADGSSYAPNLCVALTTPAIELQAGSPQLSYAAQFQLEADLEVAPGAGFDGVVVEISTDNGGSWQDLPPDSGYPGDFSQTGSPPINACGYPASQGAFSGSNIGFETFVTGLDSFAGQTIMLRWRFSSDPGVELDGFYLDDIRISNASEPLACVADELVFIDGFE